ncbi:MAG: type II toxin-antitoxin system HicB family antitoxin [Deltaproteobacteria bacterium]|jgi:predicted HicB family RNase H-like nuclease|nr:type II toxin-antitoxin system HicB family antitoxin [Deltaproteobacteria bacterium]
MKNVMEFTGGYKAVIAYEPDIDMFRGDFVGLNGGADFYAKDAEGLKKEGQISLDVFLRMCEEDGVSPKKPQGKFALRLDPDTYHDASVAAAANGLSLNQWIAKTVHEATEG